MTPKAFQDNVSRARPTTSITSFAFHKDHAHGAEGARAKPTRDDSSALQEQHADNADPGDSFQGVTVKARYLEAAWRFCATPKASQSHKGSDKIAAECTRRQQNILDH